MRGSADLRPVLIAGLISNGITRIREFNSFERAIVDSADERGPAGETKREWRLPSIGKVSAPPQLRQSLCGQCSS
jgi:hypothetical protein